MKGKPEAIPIELESPLVAQSFLAVHSKDWPSSSWSYYEKGENGLIAIEFAGAERNERADSAGNRASWLYVVIPTERSRVRALLGAR